MGGAAACALLISKIFYFVLRCVKGSAVHTAMLKNSEHSIYTRKGVRRLMMDPKSQIWEERRKNDIQCHLQSVSGEHRAAGKTLNRFPPPSITSLVCLLRTLLVALSMLFRGDLMDTLRAIPTLPDEGSGAATQKCSHS